MKNYRQGLFWLSVLGVVVAIVLLLNITARNPTHRRYSSEILPRGSNSAEIGLIGERALSKDLRLPRNDDPDQRQCICNSTRWSSQPPVSECRVCYSYSQSIANFRRPDFVSPNFIGESKNREGLLYIDTQLIDQIGDYAIAARALNVPLWVYVRVDTHVDPEFRRIVRTTGGDVVPYFRFEGYVDRVDRAAWILMLASLGLMVLNFLWGFVSTRPARPAPAPPPSKSTRPDAPSGSDPLTRAARSVDATVNFKEQAKEAARRELDKDDVRGDDTPD